MKITLEIPEPKFQKGDVLRWGELILHVFYVQMSGEWASINGVVSVDCRDAGKPLRPGTILTLPEKSNYNDDFQLCDAEKIEWDKPILEPDNMQNLAERQDAWPKQ